MATVQHNRTTAASILQIGFSGNTKCPAKDGYCRDSHIWLHIHLCLLALVKLLGLPLITHMAKHMTSGLWQYISLQPGYFACSQAL